MLEEIIATAKGTSSPSNLGAAIADEQTEVQSNQQADEQAEVQVDACGLKCPEPVMMLHKALNEVASGKLVAMQATDPTTVRDVHKFCTYLGHSLLSFLEEGGVFSYTIRKKEDDSVAEITNKTSINK